MPADDWFSAPQVTQRPHEAEWSHELIAGAAAYEVSAMSIIRVAIILMGIIVSNSGRKGVREPPRAQRRPTEPRKGQGNYVRYRATDFQQTRRN